MVRELDGESQEACCRQEKQLIENMINDLELPQE